jgi:hypothetical protein
MRDPELVARAGYAAARLEQAWERWRALHGLGGSSDPLASYVGYSHKEPMGQPRVVIGVDVAEAENFADFLESHECVGVAQTEPRPVNGVAHRPVDGPAPAPRDVPSEPMVRMADTTDPAALTGASTAARAAHAEEAVLTGPGPSPGPATKVFHQAPAAQEHPHDAHDPLAAELAGWASGELPGQASEQLAIWAAAESAPLPGLGSPAQRALAIRRMRTVAVAGKSRGRILGKAPGRPARPLPVRGLSHPASGI